MLSLMYTVAKYAAGYVFSTKEDADDIDQAIKCIENAQIKNGFMSENELLNMKGCQYKTGIVTGITARYILIDNYYVCDIENTLVSDLKVGDKVQYLAIKTNETTEPEIKKIISVVNESWETVNSNTQITKNAETEKNEPQVLQRTIIGKVIKRVNRMVYIEPDNISVDLNKVQSEFIPIVGDWLKVESVVELSETTVDLSGNVVEINRIQPLRSKLDMGTITSYDPMKRVGTIERTIIFTQGVCDIGYVPCVGDKVISDNIESDQGIYSWRSLTVVPVVQVAENRTQLPKLCNLQITQHNLNELVKNKSGIIISNDLAIDLNVQEEKTITVTIQNVSDKIHVLHKGSFVSQKSQSQLALERPAVPPNTSVLNPSDTISYIFKCKAKFVGITEELFIFDFQGFQIGRIFRIRVNAFRGASNTTCSKTDAIGSKNRDQIPHLDDPNEMTCIPGIRPYDPPKFVKVRDVRFNVPRRYWDIVLKNREDRKPLAECEKDLENAIPCLSNTLSFKSYKERFHALLYLEEIAQTINIQQYTMESVVMRRCGEYLAMQVPGLAEKRPSLLVGDKAIVSFKWDHSEGKVKYEGCIHKVSSSEIFLKFNPSFHQKYNNEDCQVTFKCSQCVMQRCHNAVNLALNRLGPNFLFPTHVAQKEPQLNIEEMQDTSQIACLQITHQRTSSVSSDSSSTSTTSTSATSSKSSKRLSVVKRLYNIESEESYTELVKSPDTTLENNTNFKNGLTNDATSKEGASIRVDLPNCRKNLEIETYVSQIKKRKLRWFNNSLNRYQKEAIRNILKGYARPLPYIIFGPPGTGKTITLCEAVLQILSMIPESRILIATPSNSSANLIAEKLLDSGILKPGDMVRLIAHHCLGSDMIPDRLLPYCATADIGGEGTRPQMKPVDQGPGPRLNCTMSVLGRHRITIGTCIAVGVLNNMGFPRGHFSHVLIDEAGQATEPEIMIPLNFIHSDHGQVVLAGDPLQLGPVVQSRLAKSLGLGESFLSRLLQHFPYQKDPEGFERLYDPRVVTKLLMNYRSLPEILQLPSSLFYDSELQAQVSPKESKESKLLQTLAEELPEREGLPPAIIFHGVNGENCRDSDSPSWYNPEEATQVYLYLLKLYKCGLTADDIGIITPYQKQVVQIRDLLLELDVALPKISSVEGFQGQERNVIIISTVRSSNTFLNEDVKHALGFVACPRRVNVAITRARALLIILGNPKLLAQDVYWRNILMYCTDRGAYTGYTCFTSNIETPEAQTSSSPVLDKIAEL